LPLLRVGLRLDKGPDAAPGPRPLVIAAFQPEDFPSPKNGWVPWKL